MSTDYPDCVSIDRTVRRQKLFTLVVLAIVSELSVFFSISLSVSFEIRTIATGLLFYGSIIVFGAYYLHATQEAEHSSFLHLKISKDGRAQEHVVKIRWPIRQIGPIEMKIRQQPVDSTQIESSRLFMGYYVSNYARYLKKKVASPAVRLGTSSPAVKFILQPAEHYYFDEETVRFFDSDKHDEPKLDQDIDGNPLIEKLDSLYIALLTGVAFCSTIVNTFLGSKILGSSLPFLLCLFFVPFYRGYLKGSLKGDFTNRLKGWENLVLILFMFLFLVFPLGYSPHLFSSVLVFTQSILRGVLLPFSYLQLLTVVLIGLVFLVLVLAVVDLGAFIVRSVALKITKTYFDNSPARRADILRAIMYAGNVRSIQVNAILSAMLHRTETELRLGDETLRVQESMVNSEAFIRGAYCKGWNWFLDIYVLCLALASTFTLLMHFF